MVLPRNFRKLAFKIGKGWPAQAVNTRNQIVELSFSTVRGETGVLGVEVFRELKEGQALCDLVSTLPNADEFRKPETRLAVRRWDKCAVELNPKLFDLPQSHTTPFLPLGSVLVTNSALHILLRDHVDYPTTPSYAHIGQVISGWPMLRTINNSENLSGVYLDTVQNRASTRVGYGDWRDQVNDKFKK